MPETRIPRAAWAIVAAAAALHLVLALTTDLSPDEAYYLAAARLGRRIVDHPPLVVWMLAASDRLTVLPVELRVRVWAIALSFATGLGCVALARSRGADDEGCVMAAWIGSWALLPTAGGFVTTPDGPLLLAVVLALLAGERRGRAGLALLGGACAKVTALPIAGLLALEGGRRRSVMWLALPLLAVPLALPSLRFQIHHAYGQGGAPGGWSPLLAAGALVAAAAAQAALWSPVVLWRGFAGLRALPSPDRALALGLSLAFALSALVRGIPPEPNWWAAAAIVIMASFARTASALSPRARRAVLASVLLPTLVAAAHTARPFLPLPPRNDPTARLHGWSRGDGHPDAAGTGTYGLAAERCVYQLSCEEISSYFDKMNLHE